MTDGDSNNETLDNETFDSDVEESETNINRGNVVEVDVPEALAGERIDRAIATIFDVSRTDASRLIAEGHVRVNDVTERVRSHHVRSGDRLEAVLVLDQPDEQPDQSELADLSVVFEDEDLIVVDKPAGVVVHPGAGHRNDTLVAALTFRFPELDGRADLGDPTRPGIVHRLDKDTSGLLVVARSPRAFASLSRQLAEHTMGRTYQALALGIVSSDEGTIEAPIGRSVRDRKRMAVRTGGRRATTHYFVLERFEADPSTTFLQVRLDTGRTHQIRVHLAAIGHPIAGDARYGGGRGKTGLSRPFLHAARLALVHPRNGESLTFDSPLPLELAVVLEANRAAAASAPHAAG